MYKLIREHFKSGRYRYAVRKNWWICLLLGVFMMLDQVSLHHDGTVGTGELIVFIMIDVVYMTLPWTIGRKEKK